MWTRRWWAQDWAPFTLLLAGAIILWVLGARYFDTGAVIVMALLIAVVGAYLDNAQKTWRPPPTRSPPTRLNH